jgi:hypothetical protein
MSKDYTKELEKMQHLMNYGINESKNTVNSNGIVEYSQVGADGKTYGILKEGTKYYVKVAPKKDTKVLAEDYDYIGGYLNRKGYDSYTKASNALNLELIHVNESNGGKEPVKSQFNINESAEWENKENKEAKAELNRFYQLCENVDNILSENVHYIKEDKNAPFTNNPSTKDGGGTKGPQGKQQPLGIKDKSYVDDGKQVNPETVYNKNGVKGTSPSGEYKAACGDNNIDKEGGNAYQEKAKTSKEQGKSVTNEGKGKRVIKLSEDQKKQVLAWRDDRAFVHNSSDSELDRSHGTEIGDTAPYDNNVSVNENFDTTEWDDGLPSSAGVGDPKKYKEPFDNQNGVTQPVSENVLEIDFGNNDYDDSIAQSGQNILDSNLEQDDSSIYNHLDNFGEGPESLGADFNNDPLADLPDDDEAMSGEINPLNFGNEPNDGMNNEDELAPLYESIKRIVETKLDDFGKHPAYQKVVMSLPPNADSSKWGEDWNDESAKGEKPYGQQIGDSAPFDDVVSAITNAVVTALGKKKE